MRRRAAAAVLRSLRARVAVSPAQGRAAASSAVPAALPAVRQPDRCADCAAGWGTRSTTAATSARSPCSTTPPAGTTIRPAADAGNGFLLRQGYSLLWSGWNWDVLPGEGRSADRAAGRDRAGRRSPGRSPPSSWSMQWTRSAPFMWGNSRGYPPVALDAPEARSPCARRRTARAPRSPATLALRPTRRRARLVPDPTQRFHVGGSSRAIYEVVYRPGSARRRARPRRDPRCDRVLPVRDADAAGRQSPGRRRADPRRR